MNSVWVSIVVATYRRPEMLRDTVLSMRRLNVPAGASFEVLVIDNDPAGSAQSVMDELYRKCGGLFELRYVHERRKGLSYARNRGIEEAAGKIIAFLDDDIFVAENWLSAMLDSFRSTGAMSVGGRTLIHWEGEPEPAVRGCAGQLIAFDLGEHDFEMRGKSTPGGGNAAFRRECFAKGLRFSIELGRVGNVLLSSEDCEMFQRLRKQGGSVWYGAKAVMYHRTGGERLKASYLIERSFWVGISYAVVDRNLHGKLVQAVRAVARLGKLMMVEMPRLAWAIIRRNPAQGLLTKCLMAKELGYARATFFPAAIQQTASNAAESGPAMDNEPGVAPESVEENKTK